MMEIVIVILEKVIKNELDDEIFDDLKMVKYILCVFERFFFFFVIIRVIVFYFFKIYFFLLL